MDAKKFSGLMDLLIWLEGFKAGRGSLGLSPLPHTITDDLLEGIGEIVRAHEYSTKKKPAKVKPAS